MNRHIEQEDRAELRRLLEPRGPYLPSGDPQLTRNTHLIRSMEAWHDLEKKFGIRKVANCPDNPVENTEKPFESLDVNMLAGLRNMFQLRRDYLIAISYQLGIAEIIKRTLESVKPGDHKALHDAMKSFEPEKEKVEEKGNENGL